MMSRSDPGRPRLLATLLVVLTLAVTGEAVAQTCSAAVRELAAVQLLRDELDRDLERFQRARADRTLRVLLVAPENGDGDIAAADYRVVDPAALRDAFDGLTPAVDDRRRRWLDLAADRLDPDLSTALEERLDAADSAPTGAVLTDLLVSLADAGRSSLDTWEARRGTALGQLGDLVAELRSNAQDLCNATNAAGPPTGDLPDRTCLRLVQRGDAARASGRHEAALEAYREALDQGCTGAGITERIGDVRDRIEGSHLGVIQVTDGIDELQSLIRYIRIPPSLTLLELFERWYDGNQDGTRRACAEGPSRTRARDPEIWTEGPRFTIVGGPYPSHRAAREAFECDMLNRRPMCVRWERVDRSYQEAQNACREMGYETGG